VNACAAGHREAATDLLALPEKWHARRAIGTQRERRVKDEILQRARRDLSTRIRNVPLFPTIEMSPCRNRVT
jgi:hypothetical protein